MSVLEGILETGTNDQKKKNMQQNMREKKIICIRAKDTEAWRHDISLFSGVTCILNCNLEAMSRIHYSL